MAPVYTVLILLLILIPLCYALYYFGIAAPHAGFSVFRATCSLPTRWEGKFAGTTGYTHRNFVVFKKYSALAIEVDTASGTLDVEIKAPDGSTLSPASGVHSQGAPVLIDVSPFKRCTVALRMERYNGAFRITLQ